MKKIYSYWLKMFYVYVLYFLIAVLVIFGLCAYIYRNNTIEVSREYSEKLLNTSMKNLDNRLQNYVSVFHNFTTEPIKDIVDRKVDLTKIGMYEYEMSQVLQDYSNRIPEVVSVIFFDNDMQMISINASNAQRYRDLQEKNRDLLDRLKGNEIWRIDEGNMALCKRLYSYTDSFEAIGYVYIIIRSDNFISYANKLKNDPDEILLLNDLGEVILCSNSRYIGQKRSDIFDAGKEETTLYHVFSQASKESNLQYEYLMNLNSINRETGNVILRFLLLTFACTWFIIVSVKRVYQKQGVPIQQMAECMQAASQGNLKSRTSYDKNDEIGYLSVEFNRMMEQLDEQVNQLIEMDIQLKKAQLRAYESQINPHFLYNTLDLIRMMSVSGENDKLEDVIICLANLLRYNLSSETEVMIGQEIKSIEDYFKILSMRFGERFDYNIDVDPEVMNCKILKFIIQPLVENSVKHGIEKSTRSGLVEVSCKRIKDSIAIIVSDNGIGMSEEKLTEIKESFHSPEHSDEHIGIKNIYKRMSIFYKEKGNIELYSDAGKMTRVLLTIPYLKD